MKRTRLRFWLLLVAVSASAFGFIPHSEAANLTGVMVFSVDPTGEPAGNFVWDTRGSVSDMYKIFLTAGEPQGTPDGLTGSFINGPTWALAPLNSPLTEGINRFTMFFQHNGDWPAFGINVFLQGSNIAQICAKAPWRTDDIVPDFNANTASPTFSMTSFPSPNAPASGSVVATFGNLMVKLTDYYVAAATVYSRDRVGTHQVGGNGRLDYVGTFTLVVHRRPAVAPSISTPPQSQTVEVGGSATFTVVADGTEPLSYQWLKNGSEIPGATGSTLSLGAVQISDAGDYSVRVSNAAGSVTSTAARLTVTPAPGTGLRLTGLFAFSSDANGSPAGNFVWDTRGSVSDFYKVFITDGVPEENPDGLTSPFINGPTWAQAPISLALHEGTNRFTMFFQNNGDWPTFALNLFFQSNNVAQISAKGPARTGIAVPSFTANSAPVTYSMTSFPSPNAPASGSTRATIGNVVVDLTDYYVAATNVFNKDRVGTHNTGANDRLDYVGTFTLVVRPQSDVNTSPIARAGLSPELHFPGEPHPFIVACNGESAAVTLDAGGSLDPDGDPITFAWFEDGGQQPFSTVAVATEMANVGIHNVILRVSDGTDHAEATLTFEVIKPSEAVAALRALLHSANLPSKLLRPLDASLEGAGRAADRGDFRASRNELGVFQNKVRAQLAEIAPAAAQTLIDASEDVINAIQCGESQHDGD